LENDDKNDKSDGGTGGDGVWRVGAVVMGASAGAPAGPESIIFEQPHPKSTFPKKPCLFASRHGL
jgi:hypothetical protein